MTEPNLIEMIKAMKETNDERGLKNYIIKHVDELGVKCTGEGDHKGDIGLTPLMVAIKHYGKLSTLGAINVLLDLGGDYINVTNDDGQTALMFAILCDHYDIAELLIFESDADIQDINGDTALIFCARKMEIFMSEANIQNVMNTAKMLLSCCNANIQNNKGETALIVAAEYDPIGSLIELLLSKSDANIKDNNWETALMRAIKYDLNGDLVKILLPKSDANIWNLKKETALMQAVKANLNRCIIQLLIPVTDVDIQNTRGETALMLAVISDPTGKLVELLADYGDVDLVDVYRMNAVLIAAEYKRVEAMRILIPISVLDMQDNRDFWSPLLFVCRWKNKYAGEMAALLIDHGCNFRIKGRDGYNALSILECDLDNCDAYLYYKVYYADRCRFYDVVNKYEGKTYLEYNQPVIDARLARRVQYPNPNRPYLTTDEREQIERNSKKSKHETSKSRITESFSSGKSKHTESSGGEKSKHTGSSGETKTMPTEIGASSGYNHIPSIAVSDCSSSESWRSSRNLSGASGLGSLVEGKVSQEFSSTRNLADRKNKKSTSLRNLTESKNKDVHGPNSHRTLVEPNKRMRRLSTRFVKTSLSYVEDMADSVG